MISPMIREDSREGYQKPIKVGRICWKGMFWARSERVEEWWMLRVVMIIKMTKKVKERIVLSEIHLRTTGGHLSMGSHSVICHPTEVTAPPRQVNEEVNWDKTGEADNM